MQNIEIKRISPDRGYVIGISMMVGIDDPKVSIEYEPGEAKSGEQVQKMEFTFYAGETELIRSELHKFVDDTIDNLYD